MTINTYNIVERAVHEGVALGLTKIVNSPDKIAPETWIDVVRDHIMSELITVIEFDLQPLDLTEEVKQVLGEIKNEQQ